MSTDKRGTEPPRSERMHRRETGAQGDPAGGGRAIDARQFFELAGEAARAQFDPVTHWDDFIAALWHQIDAGFGLSMEKREATQDAGRQRAVNDPIGVRDDE